jgi:hypothetical protein
MLKVCDSNTGTPFLLDGYIKVSILPLYGDSVV